MTDCIIPNGYKKTSLGVIPQEWEVKKISQIAEINPPKEKIISQFVVFLSMSDISENGGIIKENIVPQSSIKPGLTFYKKGDIIVAKITPCFENGKGALLNNISEDYGFGSTEFHVIRCKQCNNQFIYYHTTSYAFRKRLESQMTGSAGQKRVPADSISTYKIAIPPLPEQQKIAEIISTWDEAIEKQSQLIEKLELRKKGLMQQLLTTKRRLPGFSDSWKKVKLGDICSIKKGKTLSSSQVKDGIYPVIAGGKTIPYFHNEYTDQDVITISASGAYAGFVSLHENKIWASDCSVISTSGKNSILRFIYALLSHKQSYIYSLQIGGAQPHVFPKDIAKINICVPTKEEQTAIAEVLTAADREIELAQQKLELLRQQKHGLMQQLLTGKKRVKL